MSLVFKLAINEVLTAAICAVVMDAIMEAMLLLP
jgi:hypothetical protein